MSESIEVQSKEREMTDNDLNMVEAWGLGSSQVVASDDTKTEQTVLDLFQSDRKRALTPRNILLGKHSVQDENAIRTKGSYDGGLLTCFGLNLCGGRITKLFLSRLMKMELQLR